MSVVSEDKSALEELRPGRKIFVREFHLGNFGEEPTIRMQMVFQHGTMATEKQYELLLQNMRENYGQTYPIRCILYDTVGCGQSPPPTNATMKDFSNHELVADLDALLRKYMDPSVPTVFVGHSYGPTVLLNYFKTNPLVNLAGVVLLGTSIRCVHLQQADGGHPIMKLPLFLLRWIQGFLTEEFVKVSVHPEHETLKEAIRNSSDSNDMGIAKCYHRNMQWATESDLASILEVPALVVHGSDDQVVSLDCGKHLADHITKSRLVVVEQASHLVMIEQPAEVAKAILEFLQTSLKVL